MTCVLELDQAGHCYRVRKVCRTIGRRRENERNHTKNLGQRGELREKVVNKTLATEVLTSCDFVIALDVGGDKQSWQWNNCRRGACDHTASRHSKLQ